MRTSAPTGLTLLLFTALAARGGDEPITISLRESATVEAPVIFLKEVATLTGGPSNLNESVANIDLSDFPGTSPTLILSRHQVMLRLQLAGLAPEQYRLEGAQRINVKRTRPCLTEDDLLASARMYVLQNVPCRFDEVVIKPRQSVVVPELSLSPSDVVRLEPTPSLSNKLFGIVQVNVDVLVNGRRQATAVVNLEVRKMQWIAVAARRIDRGETLTEDNVQKELRLSVGASNEIGYSEALGKQAHRDFAPGQPIGKGDLEAVKSDELTLVKNHQQVRMVVRLGSLRVTAVGEALQDGQSGQLVRIRNIDSKKIVSGKVIGEGVVEVEK